MHLFSTCGVSGIKGKQKNEGITETHWPIIASDKQDEDSLPSNKMEITGVAKHESASFLFTNAHPTPTSKDTEYGETIFSTDPGKHKSPWDLTTIIFSLHTNQADRKKAVACDLLN